MEIIYIVIFIVTAAAVYFFLFGLKAAGSPRSTLLTERLTEPRKKKSLLEILLDSKELSRLSQKINRSIFRSAYFQNLQNQAELIGFQKMAELLVIKEIVAVLVAVLGSILFAPNYAIIAAVAGFFLPDFILNGKIKAKKEAIIRYFPETVDLIDLCIGAGLDFLSAVRWVIEKSHRNAFIEQLELAMKEIQIGKSRTDALRAMSRRLNLSDISSFTRAIIQAEKMGASVEEALKNISEDTRMSRFQRGERYAIKASLKILIPLLFFILPVIMIVVAGPIIIKFSQGSLVPGGAGF